MTSLADLGPLAQLRAGRLTLRLTQLVVGVALYGVSLGMMIRAALGVAPWDMLHLGLTQRLPLDLAAAVMLTSVVVMLGWIPLREKPGIGTIVNTLVVGPSADLSLHVIPSPTMLVARLALLVGGVLLCALASAMYIGAQFGRGPRDGLMTGLVRRTGLSMRLVRTSIEASVVVLGLLLGGPLGLGTVLFAVGIGPLTQWMLPAWIVALAPREETVAC